MNLAIYNNKDDYQPHELFALQQAGEQLLICEQGEERTLEQTRIMVACKRLKQEGNFKIVAEKAARVPKEPKAPKEKKLKKLSKKAFGELWIQFNMGIPLEDNQMELMEYNKQFHLAEGV
jgi:hypothetical protein